MLCILSGQFNLKLFLVDLDLDIMSSFVHYSDNYSVAILRFLHKHIYSLNNYLFETKEFIQ